MSDDLEIGIGVVPIDIPPGTPMGGYMARSSPSKGTHDPLHAKAIIFNKEGSKVAICVVDVVGFEKNKIIEVKKRIQKDLGIDINNILISATHTHSGPRNIQLFGPPWEGSDSIYNAVYEAVKKADNNYFKGKIEYGSGEIKGVSYNRRDFDEHSKVVDYEAVVLKISDNNDQPRAVLYNFSNHCVVMNPHNLMITADWPYYTEVALKKHFADSRTKAPGEMNSGGSPASDGDGNNGNVGESQLPDIDVFFFQGTPGNINPINVPMSNPDHTWDDVKEIGDKTAEGIIKVLNNMKELDVNSLLKGNSCDVMLEAEDEDKAEIFEFADVVKDDENRYFVSTYCQVLRIGKLLIYGIPGEAFSEIGVTLKQYAKSKGYDISMVIGYSNDYIGYYGPTEAYRTGGYEMLMMSLSENEGPQIIECAEKCADSLS
ncbi:MAG: neutral/alkaline non-lysosomal ceramidase N-terminal domain-containing protein [Promethearchaeota archaeon]